VINIRAKGFDAERAVAIDLNEIVYDVYAFFGLPKPDKPVVQRNQLQSAVGGCDLTGTFGFAIEVKRQEALSINTWWAQCVKSANERNEIPVLLFRQSKQKWRCIMNLEAVVTDNVRAQVRGEISYDDFKSIFRLRLISHLRSSTIIDDSIQTLF